MPELHRVTMTHQRADLIRDALHDVIERSEDPERAAALQDIADDLLATFDRQHTAVSETSDTTTTEKEN